MDEKTFQEYLEKRYEDQIKWYDQKACKNQKIFKIFQGTVIVLSAMTPVLVTLEKTPLTHYTAIFVSFLVAVGTTMLQTFKYHENWINYRATCEALRKEIYYFNYKIKEYKYCDTPCDLFVERVEALIDRENNLWLTVQIKKEKEVKNTENVK